MLTSDCFHFDANDDDLFFALACISMEPIAKTSVREIEVLTFCIPISFSGEPGGEFFDDGGVE